jgi:hypothetical protein
MRSRPRTALAASAVTTLLLILGATTASGADRDQSDIDRGLKLMDKADFAGALDAFRSAHDKSPTPESQARIALAEQGLKRWVDAEVHLNAALSQKDDAWIKQYVPFLQEALTEIKKHVGSLDVRGSPPRAVVEVNGEVVGLIPFFRPRKLAVGSYELKVTAPEHEPLTRTVRINAGETTAVTVGLPRIPAASATVVTAQPAPLPPIVASSPDESWVSRRRLALRVGITGMAIMAVATVGILTSAGIAIFDGDSPKAKQIGLAAGGVELAGIAVFTVGMGIIDPGPLPVGQPANHARGITLRWAF